MKKSLFQRNSLWILKFLITFIPAQEALPQNENFLGHLHELGEEGDGHSIHSAIYYKRSFIRFSYPLATDAVIRAPDTLKAHTSK